MRARLGIAAAAAAIAVGMLASPATAGYGGNTLTVTKQGAGTGTVRSRPAGINCGADCSQSYSSGTVVNLRPEPAAGSTFGGWGGACTGMGACKVTMSASKSVTATFN